MDHRFSKQIEDLLKTSREATKIDKKRAELFEAMTRMEGWKIYVELLEQRIQVFADTVLQPASSVDNAIALEYVKGAMSGVIMARDLPSVIVAAMKSAPVENFEGDEE